MHAHQDGHITTEELVTFFGETATKADAVKNAKYWLQEIDGYGENNGYITLVGSQFGMGVRSDSRLHSRFNKLQDEMLDYFYSLCVEDAYAALEELEAYEGYDAAGNDIRSKSVAVSIWHWIG